MSELGLLIDTSQLFLTFSLIVQGIVDPRRANEVIIMLQRRRAFLERFTLYASAVKTKSPLEVLDILAQKRFVGLVQMTETIRMCDMAAYLFQQILVSVLKNVPQQINKVVGIDPSKMN
jgi:hypothetical protein